MSKHLLLILLLGLACNSVQGLDMIWQQDWIHAAPPTVGPGYSWPDPVFPTTIRFATNGDLLFASITQFGEDHDVVRMSADGVPRWKAKMLVYDLAQSPVLWPSGDGGDFLAHKDGGRVIKLDANGLLQWSRSVPAEAFADLPGNRMVAVSCTQLSAMEVASGNVVWQVRLPGKVNRCSITGTASDAAGNLLLSMELDSAYAIAGSRLFKFSPQGELLWEFQQETGYPRLIGLDAARTFLDTDSGVSAVDLKSGQLLWQNVNLEGSAVLVAGNSTVPIVIADDAIHGIDANDGHVLWSQPLSYVDVFAAVGNALLVNTASGLVKLDAASGSIQWTSPLPGTDASGHPVLEWLALGGLAQGQFTAVARVAGTVSQPAPLLLRVDFSTGALGNQPAMPVVDQASSGDVILADGEMISMTVEQDPIAMRYRLSKVVADTGAPIWSHIEWPTMTGLVGSRFAASFKLTANSQRIAALIREGSDVEGNILVGSWDRTNGVPLWRTQINPESEVWSHTIVSDPVLDAHSNAWISLATQVECSFPDICYRNMLYKLDGNDGSILWQRGELEVTYLEPPYLSVPIFELIEDDVLLERYYDLFRLNGTDGSVVWTADTHEFGGAYHFRMDSDSDIVVIGSSRWGKLEESDGSLLWSATAPARTCSPSHSCRNVSTLDLPNGDLLQTGSTFSPGSTGEPMVALLHPQDASFEIWFPDVVTSLRPTIQYVAVDSENRIWMQIREQLIGSSQRLRYLTRFDPATGSWVGRQHIYHYSAGNWLSPYQGVTEWFSAPQNGRLPVQFYQRLMPHAAHYGVGVIDTQVTTEGNLAVTASVDPGPVVPGEEVSFEVSIEYSGTLALHDVALDIALPWSSGVQTLQCSIVVPNPNCGMVIDDGDLHGVFSLRPGDVVVVTGTVKALDSNDESQQLDAVVHGPTSLLEQDSSDNTASLTVVHSLFLGDFEN